MHRADLQRFCHDKWQAARASGIGYLKTIILVVLPQDLKKMAPLIVTQCVILFQDTSLVYVVSLHDFMTATSIVANTQYRIVEMYVFAAVVYFILCTLGSMLADRLKHKI